MKSTDYDMKTLSCGIRYRSKNKIEGILNALVQKILAAQLA